MKLNFLLLFPIYLLDVVSARNDPGICNDINYEILDDETRNMAFNYGSHECYNENRSVCDITNHESQSPDWKGPNWYKVDGKAGNRIADEDVDYCHCNTDATGYINGSHPTTVGETVIRTVCFRWFSNACSYQIDIQIRNCGNYYLYHLENVESDMIYLRYCTK